MPKRQHWTSESLTDFRFFVASDFVTQIQDRLSIAGLSQAQLAQRMGVTEGRISQIFNNPGNLTLNTMIQCVRSLDLKLTTLAYDDGDPDYRRGPVLSDVFQSCWVTLGKPRDNWEFEEEARIRLADGWNQFEASKEVRGESWVSIDAKQRLSACKLAADPAGGLNKSATGFQAPASRDELALVA